MTGVILTGMGRDGAQGLLEMREAGARTLGQDENSSVVYGMPRVAHEIGAVERQLPLHRLSSAILDLCAAPPRADTPPPEVPACLPPPLIHTLIVDDQMSMRRWSAPACSNSAFASSVRPPTARPPCAR
jgi:hypothetical protein